MMKDQRRPGERRTLEEWDAMPDDDDDDDDDSGVGRRE